MHIGSNHINVHKYSKELNIQNGTKSMKMFKISIIYFEMNPSKLNSIINSMGHFVVAYLNSENRKRVKHLVQRSFDVTISVGYLSRRLDLKWIVIR